MLPEAGSAAADALVIAFLRHAVLSACRRLLLEAVAAAAAALFFVDFSEAASDAAASSPCYRLIGSFCCLYYRCSDGGDRTLAVFCLFVFLRCGVSLPDWSNAPVNSL